MDNIELTLVEARSSVQALGCKGRAKLERADSLTPVSHVNGQFLDRNNNITSSRGYCCYLSTSVFKHHSISAMVKLAKVAAKAETFLIVIAATWLLCWARCVPCPLIPDSFIIKMFKTGGGDSFKTWIPGRGGVPGISCWQAICTAASPRRWSASCRHQRGA